VIPWLGPYRLTYSIRRSSVTLPSALYSLTHLTASYSKVTKYVVYGNEHFETRDTWICDLHMVFEWFFKKRAWDGRTCGRKWEMIAQFWVEIITEGNFRETVHGRMMLELMWGYEADWTCSTQGRGVGILCGDWRHLRFCMCRSWFIVLVKTMYVRLCNMARNSNNYDNGDDDDIIIIIIWPNPLLSNAVIPPAFWSRIK
jgi:hypothetical protein